MPASRDPLDGVRTPDGRYLVVRGRLWRAANPALSSEDRDTWTRNLMAARRAVGASLRRSDPVATAQARQRVDRAKRALGERGPVWWSDGTPDYNRHLAHNTPYGEWFDRLQLSADAILALLDTRADGASICPSDAARAISARSWRGHLDTVRDAARQLARRRAIVITQRGRVLDPDDAVKGPIRYAKVSEPGTRRTRATPTSPSPRAGAGRGRG